MLNGIDPIIIFQFSILSPSVSQFVSRIPVISQIPSAVAQPPIPIYLSEALTGIYIDAEDKNVDIETETQTLSDGSAPDVSQRGISSVVSVNLMARKGSLGVPLLSAMIDLLFEKVTSKEYAITYLHGATTIFRGVLHSYSVNQNANNELLSVKLEISKGAKNPATAPGVPSVSKIIGAVPL